MRDVEPEMMKVARAYMKMVKGSSKHPDRQEAEVDEDEEEEEEEVEVVKETEAEEMTKEQKMGVLVAKVMVNNIHQDHPEEEAEVAEEGEEDLVEEEEAEVVQEDAVAGVDKVEDITDHPSVILCRCPW